MEFATRLYPHYPNAWASLSDGHPEAGKAREARAANGRRHPIAWLIPPIQRLHLSNASVTSYAGDQPAPAKLAGQANVQLLRRNDLVENRNAITLREGLIRYYNENESVFSARDVETDAQEFFRCHDVAHVVFDCDTSLFGEGILKIFTIFGTTLGFWKHVSAYAGASAFSLFRQYSMRHVLHNALRLLLSVPRAIVRARSMSRPWPWNDHDDYLDKSLEEIRREFNIVVLSS